MQTVNQLPAEVKFNSNLCFRSLVVYLKSKIAKGKPVTFNDETRSTIWTAETAASTSLSIITGELRSVPSEFHLTVSPYTVNSRSPIAGVKSCNYLENILAADEAKKRGFHSAARLNERGAEITSAAMANIFWVMDGVLFTPSLKTGCLAGTTREFVLENLPCVEAQEGIDALANAESIFLISAGLGIVKVRTLDCRVLDESDHPIMHLWPSYRDDRCLRRHFVSGTPDR